MTSVNSHHHRRPVFVYDGSCGFCRLWVSRLDALTGDRVDYEPYQNAASGFPEIPRQAFERSAHFIDKDGRVFSGAAALFKAISTVPGFGSIFWLYENAPGAATLSERVYEAVSRRRHSL
ncbi:MAG: DCC1-like thiol-disulfide oxidoreductase family protein [Elusimicrobiota bacterium]